MMEQLAAMLYCYSTLEPTGTWMANDKDAVKDYAADAPVARGGRGPLDRQGRRLA